MNYGIYSAHAALVSIETLTANFEPQDVTALCEVVGAALMDCHGSDLLGFVVDISHSALIVTFKRYSIAAAFFDTWPGTLNLFADEVAKMDNAPLSVDEQIFLGQLREWFKSTGPSDKEMTN